MPKITRLLLILLVFFLTACNRPQSQPKIVPTHPELISDPTLTPDPQPEDPLDTETAPTQADEPTLAPPPPPSGDQILLEGDPIPLYAAGREITIREVEMVSPAVGWAISPDEEGIGHVLMTNDGGFNWRDISPPNPVNPQKTWDYPEVHFQDQDTGWVHYSDTDLIWGTRDGGRTWSVAQLEYTSLQGSLIFSLDQDQAWILQFLDGGMQKVFSSLSRTTDGGASWTMILDPTTDSSIQGFDKTGGGFINSEYGWITRDFRGVATYLYLDISGDGGATWQNLEMPAPASDPDAFSTCICGLYDPTLVNTAIGAVRLHCTCFLEDLRVEKNFLYRTIDGGSSWTIQSMPGGDLEFISGQTYYAVGREIYRTSDSGKNWDLIKTVNWDGQFSFINQNNALVVAYNPDTDVYALVITKDGCKSFQAISPGVLASQTKR